jgi:hypothetical protein
MSGRWLRPGSPKDATSGQRPVCPDDFVTRGQIAALFTRALDLDASNDNPFVDAPGNTFKGNIQALAAVGIPKGASYRSMTGTVPMTP